MVIHVMGRPPARGDNLIHNIIRFALPSIFLVAILTACSSDSVSDYSQMGYMYLEQGDLPSAKSAFEQSTPNERNLRGLGILYLYSGDYELAQKSLISSLQAAMTVGDPEIDTALYLAHCQYLKADYQAALSSYNSILNLRKDNANALLGRAKVYLRLEDTDNAKKDFTAYLDKSDARAQACLDIYLEYKSAGKPDLGKQYLEMALQLDGTVDDFLRGEIALQSGEYETAKNAFAKAAKTNFSRRLAYVWGAGCMEFEDASGAIEVYLAYLSKNPGDSYILNELGVSYMSEPIQDYQQAYDCFTRAIENLSVTITQNSAQDEVESKTTLYSGDAGVTGILKSAGAANLFPSQDGIDAVCRFNQVVALERMGDFVGAKAKISEYSMLYPNDFAAQKEAVFLKTR